MLYKVLKQQLVYRKQSIDVTPLFHVSFSQNSYVEDSSQVELFAQDHTASSQEQGQDSNLQASIFATCLHSPSVAMGGL